MKIKFIKSIGFGVVVTLCTTYALLRSAPQHQSASDIVNVAIEQAQPQPQKKEKVLPNDKKEETLLVEKQEAFPNDQNGEILLADKQEASPNDQIGQVLPEDVEGELQNSNPPELPNREDLTIEPEPEFFDDTQLIDSVDVGEIALTDALLAYDISDERIDEIFEKIPAGTKNNIEAVNSSHDYLSRVKTIISLIRQSDLNSEQLTMAINDIFPQ